MPKAMSQSKAGCQTCKNRRIKCDGTRPVCQRCLKSRRVCLDAEAIKQGCFSIHSENGFASGEAKRPRGPRSSLTLFRPQIDLETRALTYYLQHHLHARRDVPVISETISECLYVWKASGKVSPMVDLALTSIALATFSRTQQHPFAAAGAASKYNRLLRVMQAQISQLNSPSMNKEDIQGCLLVTALMGRYEGAIYEPSHFRSLKLVSSLCWSHDDGARAILKLWNDNYSHHHPGTSVIKRARRNLIESSLIRNLPLPDWLRDGSQYGEREVELDYDHIIVRTTHLRYTSIKIEQEQGSSNSSINVLIDEAQKLDKQLQNWAVGLPRTWYNQRHALNKTQDWPRLHFYSPTVYSYNKTGYGSVWSQYFAIRMLINDTWLRLHRMSRFNGAKNIYETEQRDHIANVTTMADALASTIPFCLDKFTVVNVANSPDQQVLMAPEDTTKPHSADLVVWPLTVASGLESVDRGHRLWFRNELAALGRSTGSSVLELAGTVEWISL